MAKKKKPKGQVSELLVLSRFLEEKPKQLWYSTKEINEYLYRDRYNLNKVLDRLVDKGVLMKRPITKRKGRKPKTTSKKTPPQEYSLRYSDTSFIYVSELFLKSPTTIESAFNMKILGVFKKKNPNLQELFLTSSFFRRILRRFEYKFNLIADRDGNFYEEWDEGDETDFMDKQYRRFFRDYPDFALTILRMSRKRLISQRGFFDFLKDIKIITIPRKSDIERGYFIPLRRRRHR